MLTQQGTKTAHPGDEGLAIPWLAPQDGSISRVAVTWELKLVCAEHALHILDDELKSFPCAAVDEHWRPGRLAGKLHASIQQALFFLLETRSSDSCLDFIVSSSDKLHPLEPDLVCDEQGQGGKCYNACACQICCQS